jgi:hypothetical protein
MLKYILASLALTVGTIHPSMASEITRFPTELVCVGPNQLAETITDFEEIPFVGGVGVREVESVGIVENNIVVFVNPKTNSFTMVERFSKDLYCVIAIGQGLRPLSGQ